MEIGQRNTLFPESSWNSSNRFFVHTSGKLRINHARRVCWSSWDMTSRGWTHWDTPSAGSPRIPRTPRPWCNTCRHSYRTWGPRNHPETKTKNINSPICWVQKEFGDDQIPKKKKSYTLYVNRSFWLSCRSILNILNMLALFQWNDILVLIGFLEYLARPVRSIPKAECVVIKISPPEFSALSATDDVTLNLAQARTISFPCKEDKRCYFSDNL